VAGPGHRHQPVVLRLSVLPAGEAITDAEVGVQQIPVPMQCFSHVHVDLVDPLPVSADGYAYLLTAIDRSTRWAEAIPLKATSAADCAFIGSWVSRFGVPATLTSNRGVQFTSSFWAAVTGRLGVRHITTTVFHPQSNGMVERFHRRLKEALKARAASTDWPAHLPWVLLGLGEWTPAAQHFHRRRS
jgi:transposase InsO family protein